MTDDLPVQGSGISLALSEDGRKLMAIVAPPGDAPPLDLALLRQEIAAQGFGQLFLVDAALNQLLKQRASASEPFTLEIGEVRDAEVSIDVSPDRMTALLNIKPPCGGSSVNAEQIQKALSDKKIVTGILTDAIEQAVVAGIAEKLPVALGRPAVDGEDGRLECLVEMVKTRKPHLDDKGQADYRDLGGILMVHQGQRLMCKHPPTPGENGENIFGESIAAKPGKDIMFTQQLKGASIDPQDPAILVAEIAGQPVMVNYGMAVEPTITLPTVDLTSGNIDFDGTVNISGDVHAGMSIRATGDIHIGGTVEAASLEAGGDVSVKGGIIGHGEVHEQPGKADKSQIARVRCGASCSALFVENASIEVGDSILVDKLVMQSELIATNQIVVGKPGTGKGNIIGGLVEATLLVQAGEIGSDSGIRTRIMVGTNPYLHENHKHAQAALKGKNHELEELEKLIAFIAAHPERITPEIRQKAEKTHTMLGQEIESALQKLEEISQEIELAAEAKVVVEKTVFSNVQIEIGGKIHRVEIERGKGAFVRKEDEIIFE